MLETKAEGGFCPPSFVVIRDGRLSAELELAG